MENYNKIYSDIDKILAEKRRKAQSAVDFLQDKLFQDEEYLTAYNEYNSIRFDISKAKYRQDETLVKQLEHKEKSILQSLKAIRKAYGLSDKDFTTKYECSACKDTGRLEDGKRCKCFIKVLHQLTFEELGLESKRLPNFKKAIYKEVNDLEKIYDKMIKFCEKFPDTDKNIVIGGKVGTGKSFLAGCIASELISKGYNAIFLSACELNSVLLKYHIAPVYEKGVILDLLTDCNLLVIDDLGSEPIYKNVTEEYLLMLLSERMNKKNPFIITTNLEQAQLLDRYGDRTLSRLNDKKHGVFIKIDGEDLRRKRK